MINFKNTSIVVGALFLGLSSYLAWDQYFQDAQISSTDPSVIEVDEDRLNPSAPVEEELEMAFSRTGLRTNTAISSIPLAEVLSGGLPKDGIPAILEPTFVTVEEASEWLDDEGLGIIYSKGDTTRFYPYAILYWHEITNDTVEGRNIAVTFCPLCGSALIFDRGEDVFGVSGKLWESNLLMYDHETETLWSQILGEAMVGDRTGETLEILDANVIRFADLKSTYPQADVQSKDTGYSRRYGDSPYGNYETNNELYFPISEEDDAFQKKELFHIVYVDDLSVGFLRSDLAEVGAAEVEVNGRMIRAEMSEEGQITVTDMGSGEQLPGFVTMWFSWVTHIEGERLVWVKS